MPDGLFCGGGTEMNREENREETDEHYRIESSLGHVGVGRLLWRIICAGFNPIGIDFSTCVTGILLVGCFGCFYSVVTALVGVVLGGLIL